MWVRRSGLRELTTWRTDCRSSWFNQLIIWATDKLTETESGGRCWISQVDAGFMLDDVNVYEYLLNKLLEVEDIRRWTIYSVHVSSPVERPELTASARHNAMDSKWEAWEAFSWEGLAAADLINCTHFKVSPIQQRLAKINHHPTTKKLMLSPRNILRNHNVSRYTKNNFN